MNYFLLFVNIKVWPQWDGLSRSAEVRKLKLAATVCGVTAIVGSERLTAVYGTWPTFHDAEVIEVHLWRGEMDSEDEQFAARVLTVKLHVMQEAPTSREAIADLRFEGVEELRMEGFNQQNALLGIKIEERSGKEPGSDGPANFAVKFERAFGMSASFRCGGIEVVEVREVGQD